MCVAYLVWFLRDSGLLKQKQIQRLTIEQYPFYKLPLSETVAESSCVFVGKKSTAIETSVLLLITDAQLRSANCARHWCY